MSQTSECQQKMDLLKSEADRLRAKHPNRIPVIVERVKTSNKIPDLNNKRFLVPADLTMGQFVYVIRKRIKLPADQALFVFVNNALPSPAALMSQVYKEHANSNGFLICLIASENCFGF